MAQFLLSAEATFSAAHTLPGVDMCDRMHGHNWRIRLTVRIDESALNHVGMGIDFRVLEQVARSTIEDFEHQYLNDLEPFRDGPPSAERIVKVVHDRAAAQLARSAPAAAVEEVALWELPQYRVIYRP